MSSTTVTTGSGRDLPPSGALSSGTSPPVGSVALGVGNAAAVAPEGAPTLRNRVSWGAILAGALVAVAVGTMLNVLGVGVGASAVDAQGRATPALQSFGIGASIWVLAANLIGLVVGGYVAARLSGTADKADGTLHGVATWATAYLVSAVLLGNVVSGIASTATSAVGSVAGGLGSAVTSVASGAAGAATTAAATGNAPTVNPQAIIDRARAALTGPSDPARMTTEQRAAEITSLLGSRIANGSFSDADRRRLTQLIAAEAGISEQDAAARIQQYEAQAQQTAQEAERRARAAADAAATGTAAGAYGIFAALLLGLVAAIVGARIGTREILALGTTGATRGTY